MHIVGPTSIIFDQEIDNNLGFQFEIPEGIESTISISTVNFWKEKGYDIDDFEDFDTWERELDRKQEFEWCKKLIDAAFEKNEKLHIHDVSCRETLEYLAEIYTKLGYLDELGKNFKLDLDTVPATTSIRIRSALYSSKDKNRERDIIAQLPPLRGSSDSRYFSVALRTGLAIGIDLIKGDEKYIGELLEKEVLSPFRIGRKITYNFQDRGMSLDTGKIFVG